MGYIIPFAMIGTGLIIGILIGVGKTDVSALLLISPMIVFGIWMLAVTYIRRRDNGNLR